jgi:glucose/arabinose dehydrogenase
MKPLLIALCIQALSVCAAPAAVAHDAAGATRIQATAPGDWAMQVVSDGLDYPWAIARAGTHFLLTEKAGNIVVIENGRQRRFPLQTSDPIADEGGAGLLGMALSSRKAASPTSTTRIAPMRA